MTGDRMTLQMAAERMSFGDVDLQLCVPVSTPQRSAPAESPIKD